MTNRLKNSAFVFALNAFSSATADAWSKPGRKVCKQFGQDAASVKQRRLQLGQYVRLIFITASLSLSAILVI
ncbi:MAG TPA: hypothetical protein VEV42_15340 [Pyrinomonadaceae bacterium]|nr:hypothetical protein [Pyrinomonadaceae bacterium]